MKRIFILLPLALALIVIFNNTYRPAAEVYVDSTPVKTPWKGYVNHHIIIISKEPQIAVRLCTDAASYVIRFDDYYKVDVQGDVYTCYWYGTSIPCRIITITPSGGCVIINATNISGGMSIQLVGNAEIWA